jgi:O-antigen ligase
MTESSPGPLKSAERCISLSLAAVLAIIPLLPTGPEYLGLPAGAWVEASILLLLVIALASRLLEPIERRANAGGTPVVVWGWVAFLAVVAGAATVGLVSENKVMTPVFLAYLSALPGDLLRPMDQATHPLHPIRVALSFFEGLVAFLLVWWICRRASRRRQRALTALGGWLLGFAATSGFAVVQHVTRFRLHPYWVEVNPNLTRAHSTLNDPNALGSYTVFGLGLTLGLLLAWRKMGARRSLKWIALTAAVLGPLALASTVSRSAWAVVPLALVLYIASPMPFPNSVARALAWSRRPARAALVLSLLGATIWLTAKAWVPDRPGYKPGSMTEVMLATLDPRVPLQDVLEGRFIWWTAGTRMFLEHPIAGVGLGRFPRLLPVYQDERQVYENAHNLYLQVASVMGLVGLVAFLLFLATLGVTLHAAVTKKDATGGTRSLASGLALGVLALLLTCITGHPLLLPSIQILFATGLAVSLAAIGTDPQRRASRWRSATLIVTLVALPVYGVAAYEAAGAAKPGAPWGYAWGVYAQEVDASGYDFRWTSPEAIFYYVPPPGARQLELIYTAAHPIRGGLPTEVWIQLGDETLSDYRQDERWTRVLLPLPDEVIEGEAGGVLLRVRVDPPLVPAAMDFSEDTRHLGIMLRPPRFRQTARTY